jgi:hypothetical protein
MSHIVVTQVTGQFFFKLGNNKRTGSFNLHFFSGI